MSVNAMETLPNPIHHFYISHNRPRSRCLQFLLGQLEIPKRNWKQWLLHAKSWGVSEMYYGKCGTDGLSLSIKTDFEVKHFFGMECGIFFLPATIFLSQDYLPSALAAGTCKFICFEFELLLYLCVWYTLYFLMA